MEYISKKSVIIIGAGISGLAAANYLRHQNINVKLLEAQNRVGGRIKTEMVKGLAFDYGVSWIHGPNGENPITSLAKKADVNTFWTNEDSIKVYDKNGKPIDYTEVDKAYTKYLKVLDNL